MTSPGDDLATNPCIPPSLAQVPVIRRLFWENVVREMLTGLSVLRDSQPTLFDGRFAVLTHSGERIPIADVSPMFACGIPGTSTERELSIAVECTVFRVRTPGGEVYTLPLHEIRALHALTPELMKQLEQEAAEQDGDQPELTDHPFGLAAFRSLTQTFPPAPSPDEPAI